MLALLPTGTACEKLDALETEFAVETVPEYRKRRGVDAMKLETLEFFDPDDYDNVSFY